MMEIIDYFDRRPDGTWACVRSFLDITAGTIFKPGDRFMDMDLVSALEQMDWLRNPNAFVAR
ncbi:MAG: hypothetical protein ACXWVQ_03550 [Methyloceanibacter sp.]